MEIKAKTFPFAAKGIRNFAHKMRIDSRSRYSAGWIWQICLFKYARIVSQSDRQTNRLPKKCCMFCWKTENSIWIYFINIFARAFQCTCTSTRTATSARTLKAPKNLQRKLCCAWRRPQYFHKNIAGPTGCAFRLRWMPWKVSFQCVNLIYLF